MSPATQGLPKYLRRFVAEQRFERYTAQEHAAWRYIMRQNRAFFGKHGVAPYLDGLVKTGISLERIPRVSEMDDCLAHFGWGAVPVEGFIPPAAFLDFQARSVLPIACDMRTVGHLAYTSAPDIVHEAAGHAPIIAYEPYARYLHRYAGMAQKAIASIDDIRLYEAIRHLSDLKENPDATREQIDQAEARLKQVSAAITRPSESARVARMNWWTVEYGLAGKIEKPRIYGAGLLSSVGESQTCLSPSVKKIPLSVDCVETAYDITEPQPQLFVARDMEQLVDVLQQFESTLSYRRGGTEGLAEARLSETVTTTQLDSGLEISGVLAEFAVDNKQVSFVRYQGPVQLSFQSEELSDQGREHHPQGFSSPLGQWKSAVSKPIHAFTDEDLKKDGIEKGKKAKRTFPSGFEVTGTIQGWTRKDGKLLLITWGDCKVARAGTTYFDPSWGTFDMAIGTTVTSVWGGPSDRAAYGEFDVGKASSSPGRTSPFRADELKLFDAYAALRRAREEKSPKAELGGLAADILRAHADEWLLNLELFELGTGQAWNASVEENLRRLEKTDPSIGDLIRKGRELLGAN